MYRQLPNLLTLLRLVLATVFFVVLNQYHFADTVADEATLVLWSSGILFILAAITDWLDGFLARRWKVESRFGRIMDPFCDKVLVMGAFMLLAGPHFVIPERAAQGELFTMISGVYPWMVVVILARELFVTSVRGELEGQGAKFGANIFGKLKMVLQSVTIPTVLFIIWLDPTNNPAAAWTRDGFVYATVIATILSGLPYLDGARRAMKEVEKLGE
ncbi:MAG: hypothetical protein GC162_11815 [Planctomycetes bacterium]|nr:hypothetical protein [Planctomycetota bacterium]